MRAALALLAVLVAAQAAAAVNDPRALVQSVAEAHVRGDGEAAIKLLRDAKGALSSEEEEGVRRAFADAQPQGFSIAADQIAFDRARTVYVVYQGRWVRPVQYGFHRRGGAWQLDSFRYTSSFVGLRDFGSVAAPAPTPPAVERAMALHREGKHEAALAGWRVDKNGLPTSRLEDLPPTWAQAEAGATVVMAGLGAIRLTEILADECLGDLRQTNVLYLGDNGQMVATYTTRPREASWVPAGFSYRHQFMLSPLVAFSRAVKLLNEPARGFEQLTGRTIELHAKSQTREAFDSLQAAAAFKLPLDALAAIRLAADREPPGRVLARLPDQQLGEHLRLRRIVYEFGANFVVANFVLSRTDGGGDWRLDSWAYDRRLLAQLSLARNGGVATRDPPPDIVNRIIEAHRTGRHTDAVEMLHTGPTPPPPSPTVPTVAIDNSASADAGVEVLMSKLGAGIEASILSNTRLDSLREVIVAYQNPTGIAYGRYLLDDRSGVWIMALSSYINGSTLLLANHAGYDAIKPAGR
ncbi:MAG: hypothetical protein JWM77_3419 [Rhodospirillales bacterium]|nr:hypothetical protein [Rhodospirillales bacterium]